MYLLNPKGLRAKIVDLLILKGLKFFVFNNIIKCSQVLNLKDLRSFRVYEFRGVHKNGAIGGGA